jgi:ATP-dependent exoDNAse (exonuclease V) alpha subunit
VAGTKMKAFPFLEPSESFQPPVIAVFAITVSKSQGQSFDHAGLYFSETIFTPV